MAKPSWIIFFHTMPAKPVAARMKVWRRLSRAGALHLKGSVYLLPYSDEQRELLSWLAQEIETLGGEADFVIVERTAFLDSATLQALFNQARSQAWHALEPEVEAVERALSAPRVNKTPEAIKKLAGQIKHLKDQHLDLAGMDFFALPEGSALGRRLTNLEERLASLREAKAATPGKPARPTVAPRRREDYQGRLWVTRPKPFVDRMASAWLIRRFLDPAARFDFLPEGSFLPPDAVGFDMVDGEFSHLGNWCTFEVLIKSFGLKEKVLARLARIVHVLDLHDGMYEAPQARGAEEILRGISRTAANDQEALEKGMAVFEMLHASLT